MLKKILPALLAVLVLLAVVVHLQPSAYTVSRTIEISAPPDKVFVLVNDFRQWKRWSPWENLDPNMKTEYEGPAAGAGSVYRWSGNDEVGKGSMKIIESRPPEAIVIDLEFEEPMATTASNRFDFAAEDGGTRVTWSMSGENNFVGKLFFLVMGGVDKALGKDFEKGLSKLKEIAES